MKEWRAHYGASIDCGTLKSVMRRTLLLSLFFCTIFAVGAGALARGMTVEERRAERMERRGNTVLPSSSAASSVATLPIPSGPISIPVLVYHHIRSTQSFAKSTWSWKMSVTPLIFERHMQWLADRHYTPIDLDTFVCVMDHACAAPEKSVVITFDDNNRSQYEIAYPLLKRFGFTGVFYLVANRLDNKANILREEVREMAESGMDIQSHTMTHAWLTTRTAEQLTWELLESKRVLEELIGTPVRHIAYPSVMHNAVVRARAAELGYVTGSVMDPRNAKDTDDRFKLPRIMMTDETVLERVVP